MSFFGLFKKVPKNNLEEIRQIWSDFKLLIEKFSQEKLNEPTKLAKNLPEFQKKMEKILYEEKQSFYENTHVLNFFLEDKIFTYMTGYALNNVPQGLLDIFLTCTASLIKELKSAKFLLNHNVQSNLITILNSLAIEIQEDKLLYNSMNIVVNFLNEFCRKFFSFPTILHMMKSTMIVDDEKVEDILIFSMLINLLKKDHLIKEYKYKKMIRRSLIICLSFEEVNFSKYMLNESNLPEVLVEKLCCYFEMIPQYVELEEDLPTLDLKYNISKMFPVMANNFSQFRDYVFFFNKIINVIRSKILLKKLKYTFFNNFLITYIQPAILSNNLKIVRTNLQYLTFIIKTSTNHIIVNSIFHFLFGLDDSKKEYLNKQRHNLDIEFERSSIVNIKDKPVNIKHQSFNERITFNDRNKKQKENPYIDSVGEEEDEVRMILDNYDYKKHHNVDIALSILTNMNNQKEMINLVIFCILEIFLEKCPLKFVDKLITPFIEVVLKKCPNMNKYFQRPHLDLSEFFESLSLYNDGIQFEYFLILDNLENTSNKSFDFFIKNDIDFYSYYVKNKEQFQNIKVLDSEFEKTEITKDLKEKSTIDEKMVLNFNKFSAKFSLHTGKIIEEFFLHNNVKINLQSKIYDEVDDIEEEFNNIYIIFMKYILEKFRNYFNNSCKENLFLCNLILGLIKIPVLNFDSVLYVSHHVLIDPDINSNCSILNMMRTHSKEISNYIKQNPNRRLFLSYRKHELKISEMNKNLANSINKSKSLHQEYKNEQGFLDQTIIYYEFLKDFISIITQKFQFENIVDELFNQYSNKLEDYFNYIKN